MNRPALAKLINRLGAGEEACSGGALRRLERILRTDGNHDRTKARLARRLVLNIQRLGSLERLPVARRRRRKRRQRCASVTPVEVDVRIHQAVNALHNRLEAAAFDRQIVLETPRNPDSTHLLEKQNPQAPWLHGCHMYRHVETRQQ